MRARFASILGVVLAAGCSHHGGKSSTEELRQTAYAEADNPGGTAPTDQGDLDCPMQVVGTSVRTEETTAGPALAFTTTGDVDELRMRVRRLAAQQNRLMQPPQPYATSKQNEARAAGFPNPTSTGSNPDCAAVPSMYSVDSHAAPGGSTSTQGTLMNDMEANSGKSAPPGQAMRPAVARAENSESGARLVFVIEDASQLERVRDRVQTSAQAMASGRCPSAAVQSSSSGTSSGYQRPAAGAVGY